MESAGIGVMGSAQRGRSVIYDFSVVDAQRSVVCASVACVAVWRRIGRRSRKDPLVERRTTSRAHLGTHTSRDNAC